MPPWFKCADPAGFKGHFLVDDDTRLKLIKSKREIALVSLISAGEWDYDNWLEQTAAAVAKAGGKAAVTGATSFAGAEAGAALGTMLLPGVGTVVGGIVGGVGGSLLGGWISE